MRLRFIILSLMCLFLVVPAANAETPPMPPGQKPDLKVLQEKLADKEQAKKRLEKQMQDIEASLEDTRSVLVDISKKVQANEQTLQALEERISTLESKKATLLDQLQNDRASISRLILALERIRRVPPEALIAKPDAPLKTAQSAMLMRDIIPTLSQQAEHLRLNLEELEEITAELHDKKGAALEASSELKAEYQKVAGLIARREKLYASTHQDFEKQQKQAKKISAQAQNLQDLVKRLDEQKESGRKASEQQKAISLPVAGDGRLPISGIIRIAYDQKDAFGAPSKGVSIEGLGGALIVAPMGGVIRFAGEFKNYGNMVIVEHKGGYHSLIAGFEKIDTVVGQKISAGEPLGYLHYSENGIKPALYYELRHNGKAIDPARKLGGLS